MKYTNFFGLPRSITEALTYDSYDLTNAPANVLSVTTIIGPPKYETLKSRHRDEVVEDASDRVWTLLGNNVHHILQSRTNGEYLSEERWYLDLKSFDVYTLPYKAKLTDTDWYKKNLWYLSGKFDSYDGESLAVEDYKVTSVYALKGAQRGEKPEWGRQLNIYAYVLNLLKFEVKAIRNILILRDWSQSKSKTESDYPQCQVGIVEHPLESPGDVKTYILERARLHYQSRLTDDDDIPECTPAERWKRESVYAIHAKGKKRAIKLHSSKADAEADLAARQATTKDKLYIGFRGGAETRCSDYCNFKQFCHFGREL